VAAIVFAVACSGDDGSTIATTGDVRSTTSDGASAGDDPLLTVAELGGAYTDAGWGHAEPSLPCRAPDAVGIDSEHPPRAIVGRSLRSTRVNVTITEELRRFDGTSDAAAYYEALADGLGCGGEIQGPTDVTTQLAAGEAAVWTVGTDDVELVVAARVDDAIVTFRFVLPAGESLAGLQDPLAIAAMGVAKVIRG